MNFKSLALTAVAALGLTANVQACKGCCGLLFWGHDKEAQEFLEYAHKNADALLHEYESVLVDAKALQNTKQKVLDFVDAAYNLEGQIAKAFQTASKDVFANPETRKALDSCLQKAFDFHGLVDTTFTTKTAPHLNTLIHKLVAEPDKYFKAIEKHMHEQASKGAFTLPSKATMTKAQEFFVQAESIKPMLMTFINLIFDFPVKNKALFMQFGKAAHTWLKDEAFWTEIAKDVPGHKFPITTSFIKLQESIALLVSPVIETAMKLEPNSKTK